LHENLKSLLKFGEHPLC